MDDAGSPSGLVALSRGWGVQGERPFFILNRYHENEDIDQSRQEAFNDCNGNFAAKLIIPLELGFERRETVVLGMKNSF